MWLCTYDTTMALESGTLIPVICQYSSINAEKWDPLQNSVCGDTTNSIIINNLTISLVTFKLCICLFIYYFKQNTADILLKADHGSMSGDLPKFP